MFRLAAHDLPFDEDETGATSVTEALWHETKWLIGEGGSSRPNARALVCQSTSSPLLYFARTAQIAWPSDQLSELNAGFITTGFLVDAFNLRMIFADALA